MHWSYCDSEIVSVRYTVFGRITFHFYCSIWCFKSTCGVYDVYMSKSQVLLYTSTKRGLYTNAYNAYQPVSWYQHRRVVILWEYLSCLESHVLRSIMWKYGVYERTNKCKIRVFVTLLRPHTKTLPLRLKSTRILCVNSYIHIWILCNKFQMNLSKWKIIQFFIF